MSETTTSRPDAEAMNAIDRLRMFSATAATIQMDAQCAREIVAYVGRLQSDRSQLIDRAARLLVERDELTERMTRRDFRRAIIDGSGWIVSAVWLMVYTLTWVLA